MSDAILMASGADDIDFMIHGLFSYELFGHKVWITTTHVCVLIVMLVLIGFAFVINRKMKHATDVPDTLQNIAELIVEKLDGMVENVMGENSRKFKNYISTIFLFILFSNISGLFGLRPPTADYGTTLAMALITFTMITFCKFKYQKVKVCSRVFVIRGHSGHRLILLEIWQCRYPCLCVYSQMYYREP